MTVILGGFADEISPDPRAQLGGGSGGGGVPGEGARCDMGVWPENLIALSGGARPRSDQPTVLPGMLVVRASTAPSSGNTIAPSLGAGKVSGPTGAR